MSEGAVYLDGEWYLIEEVHERETYAEGSRYVSMTLVLDPDYSDED